MSSTARAMVAVLALALIGGIGFLLMRSAGKTEAKVSKRAPREPKPEAEPPPEAETPSANPAALLGAAVPPPLEPGKLEDLAPAVAGAALPGGPAPMTDKQISVAAIAALPEPQIRQSVETLAARHPGLKVETVDCIDRPCSATVAAAGPRELREFVQEMRGQYGGHVAVDIDRSKDPETGAKVMRGRIIIGTDRRQPRSVGGVIPGSH